MPVRCKQIIAVERARDHDILWGIVHIIGYISTYAYIDRYKCSLI